MTITIKRLASLCTAIYAYAGEPTQVWNHYDAGTDDDVCWALLHDEDGDALVLRGSLSFKDWIHDSELFAPNDGPPALDVNRYPMAAQLHFGFSVGLGKMWGEALPMLRPQAPLYITGHSLGAGRAAQLLYMAACDKVPVAGSARFGEPMSMYDAPAKIVAAMSTAQNTFRNYGAWYDFDGVTVVPPPPLPFVHPVPLIPVNAPPQPGGSAFDRYGPFARHHMVLYESVAPNLPADQPVKLAAEAA